MALNPAYRRLSLYTTLKSYTLVPEDESGERSLTIHRDSGDIVLNAPGYTPQISGWRSTTVYGIVGVISLSLADYLIVITQRELRAQLMGHDIFVATKFNILPISPDDSIQHHPVESYLLGLLRLHLGNGLFWISYDWDLTSRLQGQWASKSAGKALWEVADDRFFWNKFLQTRLIDITRKTPEQNLSPYILPVLCGTFDVRTAHINGHTIQLCLISRRSRYRAGTRYFRRGIDSSGHVANFNETEQILVVDPESATTNGPGGRSPGEYGSRLSFVQIRGSIPLYWAEVNTLRYKPDLQIMEKPESEEAMRRHLQEQVNTYGEQNMVNMVNHKGYEKPIKDAFEKYFEQLRLPKVKYEYFDFHSECRNMQWERISELINRVETDLLRQGYFHQTSTHPETPRLQMGVVRTNCMDNLDRTNVAQAALAKWTLNRQLRDLDILSRNESIDDHEEILNDFRNMWADHANLISTAYSGTGALKTDYTRTGKRSRWGLLQDGVNSIMRYLKNNYFDGPRQDAYDLFTGSWTPRPGMSLTQLLLVDERPLIVRSMPYIAWFATFMICAGLTLPRTSDYSLLYWFLLWFTILSISLSFIFAHGMDYVAWPRLVSLSDVLSYEGPGYKSSEQKRVWNPRTKLDAKRGTEVSGYAAKWAGGVGAGGAGRKRIASGVNEIEMGTRKRLD